MREVQWQEEIRYVRVSKKEVKESQLLNFAVTWTDLNSAGWRMGMTRPCRAWTSSALLELRASFRGTFVTRVYSGQARYWLRNKGENFYFEEFGRRIANNETINAYIFP